jgi:hypothetical protein
VLHSARHNHRLHPGYIGKLESSLKLDQRCTLVVAPGTGTIEVDCPPYARLADDLAADGDGIDGVVTRKAFWATSKPDPQQVLHQTRGIAASRGALTTVLGSTLPPTAEPVAVRPILCKARPCPKGTN